MFLIPLVLVQFLQEAAEMYWEHVCKDKGEEPSEVSSTCEGEGTWE